MRRSCLEVVAAVEAGTRPEGLMSRPPEGFKEEYGTEELFPVLTRPRVIECTRRFVVPVDAGGPNLHERLDELVRQHTGAP